MNRRRASEVVSELAPLLYSMASHAGGHIGITVSKSST